LPIFVLVFVNENHTAKEQNRSMRLTKRHGVDFNDGGEAYRKERSVILREDDVGVRARICMS